ncbi:hypothetical protein ADT26_14385 [Xanthomonas oryzae]|nr:hypothetical protein BE73_05295 [Xanthomonas oryzae pv. oryzicola]KOR42205.1 hypothetical protein ADT26_14385 [Xanthomonas oryzae]
MLHVQGNMIKAIEEVRQGAFAKSFDFDVESLDQCLDAVRRMNGGDRTLISFSVDGLSIMVGGGDGQYVVTMESDESIVNVVNSSASGDEFVEITVGGQACEYPDIYVVGLDQVEAALRHRIFNGEGQDVEYEVIPK